MAYSELRPSPSLPHASLRASPGAGSTGTWQDSPPGDTECNLMGARMRGATSLFVEKTRLRLRDAHQLHFGGQLLA